MRSRTKPSSRSINCSASHYVVLPACIALSCTDSRIFCAAVGGKRTLDEIPGHLARPAYERKIRSVQKQIGWANCEGRSRNWKLLRAKDFSTSGQPCDPCDP